MFENNEIIIPLTASLMTMALQKLNACVQTFNFHLRHTAPMECRQVCWIYARKFNEKTMVTNSSQLSWGERCIATTDWTKHTKPLQAIAAATQGKHLRVWFIRNESSKHKCILVCQVRTEWNLSPLIDCREVFERVWHTSKPSKHIVTRDQS